MWASYGQRPSSELLISYGFAPEVGENPDDEYALTLGIDVNDPYAEAKAQVLRDMGLSPVETFPLRLNGYPRQLLQYASFILCNPESRASFKAWRERRSPAVQTLGKPSSTLCEGWPTGARAVRKG